MPISVTKIKVEVPNPRTGERKVIYESEISAPIPALPVVPPIPIPSISLPKLPEIPSISLPELPSIKPLDGLGVSLADGEGMSFPQVKIPALPAIPPIPIPALPVVPPIPVPSISLPKLPEIPSISLPELPSIKPLDGLGVSLPEGDGMAFPEVKVPGLPAIPPIPIPALPVVPPIPIPSISLPKLPEIPLPTIPEFPAVSLAELGLPPNDLGVNLEFPDKLPDLIIPEVSISISTK